MGYHSKNIQKGEFGHASKIREEYEEFFDAYNQNNPVMELVELSDLIGAIEAYALNHYDIELRDLIVMKDATKSAFEDGTRKSSEPVNPKAANFSPQKWRCRRCGEIVDYVAFRCKCKKSPSPWEPIED